MSQIDFADFNSPLPSGASSSLGLGSFGFNNKTNYDANGSLIQIRSERFEKRPKSIDDDIWKRPPPDFRPQKFAPNPPKRNSRDSMRPWLYGTFPGQRQTVRRETPNVVRHVLKPKEEKDKGLVTMFHIDRPFTAKKKFVREGMYEAGEFDDPTPHDFRGYPPLKTLGLPEFVQSTDKDPFNLKFHSDRLDIIHGDRITKATDRDIKGIQMAPPKSPPPLHQCDLLLEKGRWPVKNEAFTRFRVRHRPAHSAFMERATNLLDAQWAREMYEKSLRQMGTSPRAVQVRS